MEDLAESLKRGDVSEVKVVLASDVLALACYQMALIGVGCGKGRLPFLEAPPAASVHRAAGEAIAVVVAVAYNQPSGCRARGEARAGATCAGVGRRPLPPPQCLVRG